MNYNNPELIDRLSAEYVLGTLQGKARDRFEHLMEASHRIRQAVWSWENQITPMITVAPVTAAPNYLWPSIKSRLFGQDTRKLNQETTETNSFGLSKWFWPFWGISATAASLILALLLVTNQSYVSTSTSVDSIALVSDQNAEPQWLVSFDMDTGELKARALNAIAVETGRAFELWVLPEAGNPQSLGLLPVATSGETASRNLPTALIDILRSANGLAVSIEPEGGSPTGLPTGPVVYQSSILSL